MTQHWPPGTRGLDLSRYQGLGVHAPDFKKVAAAGIEFVIHKATEGSTIIDSALERNVKAALDDGGLASALYGFNQPDLGPGDAVQEALWLCKQHKKFEPYLRGRPWQDLEKTNGLTKKQLTQWHKDFVSTVESEIGLTPVMYSGVYFIHAHLDREMLEESGLDRCPLVVAAYPIDITKATIQAPPAPWTQVDGWQFTGHGRVDGILGDVDLDVAPNGFDALQF